MQAKIITKNLIFIVFLTLFLSGAFVFYENKVFASSTDGTIDSSDKYAWTENSGWLNFGTTEGDVHVTDSALAGYIWAENIGWISLNCSNDSPSSCGTVDYKIANDGEGTLSGYAWSENTGWINFNPTYGGVTINSSGEFLGYAWGENIGWIVFNCATTDSCATVDYKVKTDWRPRSARPACNNSLDDDGDGRIDYPNDPGCDSLTDTDETDPVSGGGGMPIAWHNLPKTPEGGFRVLINNDAKYTDSPTVTLDLSGGPEAARMAISNNPEFSGIGSTGQLSYQSSYQWNLCRGTNNCPKGAYTVYVQFYASWGKSSGVVSDSVVYQKEKPIETPIIEGLPVGFTFETNLRYGMVSDEVKYLQIVLNSDPDTQLAREGVGSPGRETNYFGTLTRMAVIKFQEKYAQDILAPWGLTKGTGYVGKTTQDKLNEILGQKESELPAGQIAEIPTNYRFTTDLKYNQKGDNIRYLQIFLKSQEGGIYPEGIISGWFGPLTKNAVIRFQEKYAQDILAPWGLTKGTGYVGKTTQDKLNEILGR